MAKKTSKKSTTSNEDVVQVLTFEERVTQLMAIDPATKTSAMRREDAERIAASEGLRARGR